MFCREPQTSCSVFNQDKLTFKTLPIFAAHISPPHTFWFVTTSFPNSDSLLQGFAFLYSKTRYYFAECAFEKPDVHFPYGLSQVVVPANLLPLADTEIISEYSPISTSPKKENIVNNTYDEKEQVNIFICSSLKTFHSQITCRQTQYSLTTALKEGGTAC